MERPRLVRLASAAAAALLIGAGATACSSGPLARPAAATVGGVEITREQVQARVDMQRAFYRSAKEAGLEGGDFDDLAKELEGDGARDTIAASAWEQALLVLVRDEVVRQALDDADATVTSDQIDQVRQQIEGSVAPEVLAGLDADYMEDVIQAQAAAEALTEVRAAEMDADAELTPEELEQIEVQRDARYQEIIAAQPICVALIQSDTLEDAQAARDRIDAGADFGTVADEVSTLQGVGPGGEAGCGSVEEIEGAFTGLTGVAAAQAGDVFGPLELADADGTMQQVLVEISGTSGPSREQAQAQLEQEVPAAPASIDPSTLDPTTVVSEYVAKADIHVDPRYGTWDPETFSLRPAES